MRVCRRYNNNKGKVVGEKMVSVDCYGHFVLIGSVFLDGDRCSAVSVVLRGHNEEIKMSLFSMK